MLTIGNNLAINEVVKNNTKKVKSITNFSAITLNASDIGKLFRFAGEKIGSSIIGIPEGASRLVRGRFEEALSVKRKCDTGKLRFKWQKSVANSNLALASGDWMKMIKAPTNSLYDYLNKP